MQPLESDSLPLADESLAEYLRRLRVRLGLTQKEVALKANIHAQSLGKLERGKTLSLNH
ncbi:helix-turn-helix domain-containing protein, partial [Acaryochloris marina NIES-2412]